MNLNMLYNLNQCHVRLSILSNTTEKRHNKFRGQVLGRILAYDFFSITLIAVNLSSNSTN